MPHVRTASSPLALASKTPKAFRITKGKLSFRSTPTEDSNTKRFSLPPLFSQSRSGGIRRANAESIIFHRTYRDKRRVAKKVCSFDRFVHSQIGNVYDEAVMRSAFSTHTHYQCYHCRSPVYSKATEKLCGAQTRAHQCVEVESAGPTYARENNAVVYPHALRPDEAMNVLWMIGWICRRSQHIPHGQIINSIRGIPASPSSRRKGSRPGTRNHARSVLSVRRLDVPGDEET